MVDVIAAAIAIRVKRDTFFKIPRKSSVLELDIMARGLGQSFRRFCDSKHESCSLAEFGLYSREKQFKLTEKRIPHDTKDYL